MSADLREIVRKYALQNAALHKGSANPKAVVGKVMGEVPELRSRSKEVSAAAEEICAELCGMNFDDIVAETESINPDLLKKTKSEKKDVMIDLPDTENGVVMRMAPGPSGPLHIGHTRVAIINDYYVKKYKGKYINRLEDTNPEKIDPDAYKMIPEDLKWLGVHVDETVIQSDRFEIYYDIARKLIDMGQAYVCTCEADSWRKLKESKKACPCRSQTPEEAHELFDKMLAHGFGEGEAILVVKTDLDHPNPAVRDFVGLRINDTAVHPRTGTKYVVYPMMNLSVAVDDHLLGLTHVIRGKDHLNNTIRQEYIFKYFGWKKPWYHHYGFVKIPDSILKTSTVGTGIKNGEYTGWDDVRLGTVRAIAKRGIQSEAIRNYWLDVGMKDVDIEFSWDNLYAFNRQILDPITDRYFFVENPEVVEIKGVESLKECAPLHPDHPERGARESVISSPVKVYMTPEDLKGFKERGTVRLKDLCNLKWENDEAVYTGTDHGVLKEGVKISHWAPIDGKACEILMPDGTVKRGVCENIKSDDLDKVIQFERFGFVRIGKIGEGVEAYFTQ